MGAWLLGHWNIMDNSKYSLLRECEFLRVNITVYNIINWLHYILFPTYTIAKKSYFKKIR